MLTGFIRTFSVLRSLSSRQRLRKQCVLRVPHVCYSIHESTFTGSDTPDFQLNEFVSNNSGENDDFKAFKKRLNEQELDQMISSRQLHWQQQNTVATIAENLLIPSSKVEEFVLRCPAAVLLDNYNASNLFATEFLAKQNVHLDHIQANLRLVCSYHIDLQRLRDATWIWLIFTRILEKRLIFPGARPEIRAVFCSYSPSLYKYVRANYSAENANARFDKICELFEPLGITDRYEMLDYLQHYKFLLWAPFERTAEMIDVMLKNGVDPYYILRDLWSLRYKLDVTKDRLKRATEAKVGVIKPWMFRCPEELFVKYLHEKKQNKLAFMPYIDIETYIAGRLNVDVDYVKQRLQANKSIYRIKRTKIIDYIDFFLEEGYESREILRGLRVLMSSLERTKKRIALYKSLTGNPPRLNSLYATERQFNSLLTATVKGSKRKNDEDDL